MKRTKVLVILLVMLLNFIVIGGVNAHSVELDPEDLIIFPNNVSNGEGEITIDSTQTGYSLYYQVVAISDSDYTKMTEEEENGRKELARIDEELNKLGAECDNLEVAHDEAYNEWKEKVENEASEEEIEKAKTAYEEAKTKYKNKIDEYNAKADEYNNAIIRIRNNINSLIPTYNDNKWIKTEDGSFNIDSSEFTENKAFAFWAKLICSDGNIYYDLNVYTTSDTDEEEIKVQSVSLDKKEISIKEGSSYTLVATINPTDATNKTVTWSSSNESVATVKDGKVTAVAEGTATITVTTQDGGYKATCKVTVTKKDSNQKPDDEKTDDTVADGELPQTGSFTYFIIPAIIILGIIMIVTYKKIKYLNN